MEYNRIKTVPSLFEIEEPKATKSKEWANGQVSYIVRGTIAKLTNEELANLCGDYEEIIKIYRNSPKHAVVVLQVHKPKGVFYSNCFGGFETSYIPGIGKMYIK